jgi:hypothetical protein
MLCAGISGAGKTEFVKKLLRFRNIMIDYPPNNVIWCYGQWQPAYGELSNDGLLTANCQMMESNFDLV